MVQFRAPGNSASKRDLFGMVKRDPKLKVK